MSDILSPSYVALSWVWGIAQSKIRTNKIRRYAACVGFSVVKDLHPVRLRWKSSVLDGATAIKNAVFGEKSGKEFAFFDCQFGRGKGSFAQSIVAFHSHRRGFGAERLDPSLIVESIDDWTLLYRHKELFSFEELEAIISSW